MKPFIRILHLEDDPNDVKRVQAMLDEASLACRIAVAKNHDEFEKALEKDDYDVILVDYRLLTLDGMSALRSVLDVCPDVPFILVSGTMGEGEAIEALSLGATDYVLKQKMSRLVPAVERAFNGAESRRELKRARDESQRSTEMLQAVIEAAPVAIFGLDLDGRVYSVWNPAAQKMFGWSAQEAMDRLLPILPAKGEEEFWNLLDQMKSGKTLVGNEVHFQRRDGSPLDCSIYSSPLHDTKERITGNICLLMNITERKQAERERLENLRFSESMDRINRTIQGADDLEKMISDLLDIVLSIFDCDRAHLICPCDPNAQTWDYLIQRYKPEYPGVMDFNRELPIVQFTETLRILLASDGPVAFGPGTQYKMPGDTSKQFDVKCMMSMAIYPKTGRPWQFGIQQCSHARVWSEDENRLFETIGRRLADGLGSLLSYRDLQESEARYRRLAENATDVIWTTDMDMRFTYVSPSVHLLRGYSADEAMEQSMDQVLTPESLEIALDRFSRERELLKQNGVTRPVMLELEQCCKDGTPVLTQSQMSFLTDSCGEPMGILGITRDITERKQAERERLANLRFFESMDRVNRAIQGTGDLDSMMQDLLDVVLSIFDCDRTFLLYPCDPESPAWSVPMECNKPEYPGVLELKQEIPMDPQVAETLRILLAADGPVVFGPGTPHDLPQDVSEQFGIKSFMSMAIHPKTGRPWQFGIHQCTHARIWTAEEMRIFEAVGRRLADGLSSLLSYRDLRRNEEFLDNVVEHIPDMIFVKDARNLRFVRFNKAGERLLGYTREELLGKSDCDFFPKEIADFFTAKDRQTLDAKELVDIPEETIRNRSNAKRILHTKKIPILDETGAPKYLLGISEDITEQKLAQEAIRMLSEAIEQSPVSIVITDLEGKIEFVNTAFTQITGYTFAEALGRNLNILKSGETSAEDYRRLWQTISSGGVWRGEFRNRKKNGELFWEEATIAPVRNAEGAISHYVAFKEDISERKQLENQLRQAQKMEAIGQLAGGVAHDFNNMLGVIMGHSEIALDKPALDDSLRGHLEQILEAGRRSAQITRQLLAFARKQAIAPEVLDLNETIEGILKLLRRLIGESIDLAWLPGAKLWPIKMDPSQIDQVLANLCINAKDAIGGVGKITIETHTAVFDDVYCAEHRGFSPGEYIMLAVSDNGRGMDKSTMDRIFEPFFTTKEVSKGTGLGLATVYGIVKQNSGFINVYSEPEHGSTFKIYLPRYASLGSQAAQASPEPTIPLGDETILVVEDEVMHLKMVTMILDRCGYRILTASSPKEALHVAKEHTGRIHLLLTDLIMPEMNGRDLAKEITAVFPDIQCLIMSGYTGNGAVPQGILEGPIHFIQKPFSTPDLANKVRKTLDGG